MRPSTPSRLAALAVLGLAAGFQGCSEDGDDSTDAVPDPAPRSDSVPGTGGETLGEGDPAAAEKTPTRGAKADLAFETPPGFAPWRDPFESVQSGPQAIRRAKNILALGLECARKLDLEARFDALAAVVSGVGRYDPTLATTALENALEWLERLPEEGRWPALAKLAGAATRLLPEAGGPFLLALMQRRQEDALAAGEGEFLKRLVPAIGEPRTPTEERMKLGIYVLSQVGRVSRKSDRKEILVELATVSSRLGPDHGPPLLEQILAYAHLAVDPAERAAVRFAVAQSLAALGSAGGRLPGSLLVELAREAPAIDAEEDRTGYVDLLAAAADGAEKEDRRQVLDLLSSAAAKFKDADRRTWACDAVVEAWARFALATDSKNVEPATALLERASRDPLRRATSRARLAAVLAPREANLAVQILDKALEEVQALEDPAARESGLVAVARSLATLPDEARRPLAARILEFDGDGGERAAGPEFLALLAELDPAPESARARLERATRAAPGAGSRGPAALQRVLEAARKAPGGPESIRALLDSAWGASRTGRVGPDALAPDPMDRSRFAEAAALEGAALDWPRTREAFLDAVAAAGELGEPETVRTRLVELAAAAPGVPPLDAEGALFAILAAEPAAASFEGSLELPFWVADSLAAIGSPRLPEVVLHVTRLFEESPSPPPESATTSLAWILSMAGGSAAERARAILERIRSREDLPADLRLSLDVAIALGLLAGDPRSDVPLVERALGEVSDSARDLVYADILGRRARRLDPVLFERLAKAPSNDAARARFVVGAALNWP